MDDILIGLNDQQRCAVTCPSNVLQVLAPPGSGKTKTLTARVAYHIAREGLKPWNMIVCTFTIKAAREMKERIRSFVGDKLESKLVLGTFHSVARRYLSTYGHHIGIPKHFGIADSNDSLAMIKRIIKKNDYHMEPAKARSRISKRKSGLQTTKNVSAKLDLEQQEFDAIFAAYEQELESAKLLDYDDLLLRCVELLREFPECVSNIEAVLIDEFQDTNHVQYELMSLFGQHRGSRENGRTPRITIVGDPDQSIYSFRSAEIENLTRMRNKYAETQVVHLEENYRSSGAILQFAIEVIEQDTDRPQKKLQATHSIGQAPVLRTLVDASTEAAWLVSEIRRSHHLNSGLLTYSDYAILLRSSSLSLSIETALGKAGIPYRMVGGHKFFDRVEIRILLDYLRVISQPDHSDALLRIINVPARKLGDKAVKALIGLCEARSRSLWEIIKAVSRGSIKMPDAIKAEAARELSSFVNIVLTAHQKLNSSTTTVADMLAHVMQKINYEKFLRSTYKMEYEDRAAHVDELVQLAESGKVFAEQEEDLVEVEGVRQQVRGEIGPSDLLAQFLSNIALATEADKHDAEKEGKDISAGEVVISTIHAAKGLEWPVVFIPAAYQGSIPHSRAEDIDEERRLLYVGMTRAKALLYLSWPKKSSNREYTTLSPFLSTTTIARYYATRGPSFGWSVSNELARILGRNCPSGHAIENRYLSMNAVNGNHIRAEDDYYPENGEEREQHANLLDETYTLEELERSYTNLSKKRKFSLELSTGDFGQAKAAPSTGFTSARQQMQDVNMRCQAEIETGFQLPESRNHRQKMTNPTGRQKPLNAGQSSIKSFFQDKLAEMAPQLLCKASNDTQSIATSITGGLAAYKTPRYDSKTTKSKPAETSSSALREMPRPNVHRPRLHLDEDEKGPVRHILLSSSPTKPEDSLHLPGRDSTTEKSADVKQHDVERQRGEVKPQVGFQNSSFLHQTSMQKLGRTFGARPSSNAYVNTKFRKPTFR